MGAEYVSGKRPSSSRRSGAPHEGSYGDSFAPHRSATSPRPGTSHSRQQPAFMHTPLHTPPPPHHSGTPLPNIYAYGGFGPQGEYVSYIYPSGPTFRRHHGDQQQHRHHNPYQYERPTATTRSRRYWSRARSSKKPADGYSRVQFVPPSYTPAPGPQSPPPAQEGRRSRSQGHRREATWSGENSPRSPPRTASTKPAPPHRAPADSAALEQEELRRRATDAGIPSDYSLKNWDPKERPIILLGSVFDASSLGEWVFNWTKYHHGRTHEATRTAGGLWELLIELSSKLKRARDFYPSIQTSENKETVQEFIVSGDRLWSKLKDLLKCCEEYMWRSAKRVTSPKYQEGKTKVQMGKQSGAEFVDAMFNGEKEWEKTERLMRGMATWCHRFQVNCEDILKRPDA